jgi:predicted aspartyl protease
MGRIIAHVEIANTLQPDKSFGCEAIVDTGASMMVLPSAWRDRLGDMPEVRKVEVCTATQERVVAVVCGPANLQIEAFPPIIAEIAFIDMTPVNGKYEPLLGYIPLEQSQAVVDLLGHRLVYVQAMDLK